MRRLVFLVYVCFVMPAFAQAPNTQHLVLPDLATCQARSAAVCAAMGCDGVQTKFWWDCDKLMSGTAALRIEPDNIAAPAPPPGKGLTAGERVLVKSRAQMGTDLPYIIPAATILGKISPAKRAAITNFAATHPVFKTWWDGVNAGNPIDLGDPRVYSAIQMILAAGRIASTDADAMTQPQTPPP